MMTEIEKLEAKIQRIEEKQNETAIQIKELSGYYDGKIAESEKDLREYALNRADLGRNVAIEVVGFVVALVALLTNLGLRQVAGQVIKEDITVKLIAAAKEDAVKGAESIEALAIVFQQFLEKANSDEMRRIEDRAVEHRQLLANDNVEITQEKKKFFDEIEHRFQELNVIVASKTLEADRKLAEYNANASKYILDLADKEASAKLRLDQVTIFAQEIDNMRVGLLPEFSQI